LKHFVSLKIKFVFFFILLIGGAIFVVTVVLSQKTAGLIMKRLELEATDKTKLVDSYLEKEKTRLATIAKSLATIFDILAKSNNRLQLENFAIRNGISKIKVFNQKDLIFAGATKTKIMKIAKNVYQRGVPFTGIIQDKQMEYYFVSLYPMRKLKKLIYLKELFKNQISFFNQAGKCWKSTIFNRDGVEYYHGFSVPKKRIEKLIEQSDRYTKFELSILGFRYVISLHGIYNYWNQLIGSFGSMVLEYDAYEALNDNYLISTETALLIFVFIGLLAFYFISKIVRSYKEISMMSLEIAHGNLNKRISYIPNDELGELIISVNMMADSVKASIELKKSLSKELRKHQLASGLSVEQLNIGQTYLREKSVFTDDVLWKSLERPLLVLSNNLQNCVRISRNFDGEVDHVSSQRAFLEMVEKGDYKAVLIDASSSYTPFKMLKLKQKYSQLVKIPFYYR